MKNINCYSKCLTVVFQCDLGVNLTGISEELFFKVHEETSIKADMCKAFAP